VPVKLWLLTQPEERGFSIELLFKTKKASRYEQTKHATPFILNYNKARSYELPAAKIRNMKQILVFVSLIILFASCEKDMESKNILLSHKTNIEEVEVESENDYLVLKSFEDANSLASILQNYNIDRLKDWTKSLNILSMREYFDGINNLALSLTNSDSVSLIVEELKQNGYFNHNDSSVCYPIFDPKWSSILNKDGIIKIENIIYKFLDKDMVYTEENNIEKLKQVKSTADYNKMNVRSLQINYPININNSFKSGIMTPLLEWDLVAYNTVAGDNYRSTANFFNEYYVWEGAVTFDSYCMKISLHKKTLGIWWRYNDYVYRKMWDVIIGGNNITTNSSTKHPLVDYHNPSPEYVTNYLQKWDHSYYLYPYELYASPSNYNHPTVTQVVYEWYSMKVNQSQWCVVNDLDF